MKTLSFVSFFVFSFSLFSQEKNICSARKSQLSKPASCILHPASNTSDTIHVRHYNISIDTIDFSTQTIRAKTTLTVQSKMNGVNNISLSLLELQIDSIKLTGQITNLSYSYNDTTIHISPLAILNQNDSTQLTIFYQGKPQTDPSGFGGFYFQSGYAFNLGVGFDADPHVFGRVWFPCIDEFTDRATYEFRITTSSAHKAFCNGILQSSIDNGNGTTTWNWLLNQTIPTYLAAVAVTSFYTINRIYNGTIPIQWGVLPADSTATLNTFANIDTAISNLINHYGPYPWDKIGFVMTPVTYGGMEHATSIHISKVFIDGTKNYETLWAHELSHMWWGDKVTCDKEEEMWLNEGWATFNEHTFTEAVYGNAAYRASFRTDHRRVLEFAHIDDGSYLALNNIPHAYTYADLSVYQKGSLTCHTLRNYMGDAKFFQACKDYLNNLAYGNASSYDMRDEFANSSGINMNDFFDGWVFTPGFPQFSIDSTEIIPNGNNFDASVFTRQKQKGNTHTYKMKVECNFTDGVNDTDIVFLLDAYTNNFTVTLPFNPLWISVDRNEKMMDAITDYEKTISTNSINLFPETNVSLNVQDTGAGKSIVRIEHNWVAPDWFKDTLAAIRLSDYHYWKVDGIFANNFRSKATFTYDGTTSSSTGYIDNTLITTNEDSLLILYRASTADDWKKVNSYTHNKGITTDKKGNFIIDTLKKGEYVFGKYDYTVVNVKSQISNLKSQISIYPNPASALCRIEFSLPSAKPAQVLITDISGKTIFTTSVFPHQQFISWDTYQVPNGIYSVNFFEGDKKLCSEKVVIVK